MGRPDAAAAPRYNTDSPCGLHACEIGLNWMNNRLGAEVPLAHLGAAVDHLLGQLEHHEVGHYVHASGACPRPYELHQGDVLIPLGVRGLKCHLRRRARMQTHPRAKLGPAGRLALTDAIELWRQPPLNPITRP
jgi:hypothetical protein